MDCDVCGFHADHYTAGDLRTTLETAPLLAADLLHCAPAHLAARLAQILAPVHDQPAGGGAEAAHEAMHRLHEAGRLCHAGTATRSGSVVQVNRSGGGVPKLPVDRVAVRFGGVEGDVQQNRRHHGRPWQAVCLWSAEVVETLQAEGHPIRFGSAGENLSLRGLDWSVLTPGARLMAGTAVLQVTAFAIPCAKNAAWFSDGDFRRMSQQVRPGTSRLYASVLVEGMVAAGDPVVVEPSQIPAQPTQPGQLSLSVLREHLQS